MKIKMGENTFTFPSKYFIDKQKDRCYLKMRFTPDIKHWVLGEIFFYSFYAIFDYDKQMVGFSG
jgi:hypothetical protein